MSVPLDELCPVCRDPLEVVSGRHGIVLACVACQGAATTLAVLRKVAPRAFVNHLWQAAWKHGLEGEHPCPGCARPLLELRPPHAEIRPRIDVCIRCYLVWLGPEALSAAPVAEPVSDAQRREALLAFALRAQVDKVLRRAPSGVVAERLYRAILGAS